MNSILQDKLNVLQNANDYECWYLVKQPTAFDSLCYLVSFLKEFKSKTRTQKLQDFISEKVIEINDKKPNAEISNNYRSLRVAAFFGLITMTSKRYEDAIITETFEEINERCNGNFEEKELYKDIIQRQIEKMFISSSVDEEYNGIRKNFRLYPVMLLYKVLIELGRSTGNYSVTMTEYRYLIATTEKFENFLETLLLIKLLRTEPSAESNFEQFCTKFDNRLIQALKQLPTLKINNDSIELVSETIPDVAKKVFIFESNPNFFLAENYLSFLGSKKSLSELEKIENSNGRAYDVQSSNSDEFMYSVKGKNILYYGVPGTGKSYTIKQTYHPTIDNSERVVFHPDYTNSDFVGQILPETKKDDNGNDIISYPFTPGPFTRILAKASKEENKDKPFYLIIEEINRGNAPAIFGEIFQLLDRYDETDAASDPSVNIGESAYSINNVDIAKEVYGDSEHPVKIPANLFILATMNTADQNVFTLDTAFKRRWTMKSIKNDFSKCVYANKYICGKNVTWIKFATKINDIILDYSKDNLSSEDNRLGAYFVKANELNDSSAFAEKVLMYLWNDVFKHDRETVFKNQYKSLEQLIDGFEENAFDVFVDSLEFDNSDINNDEPNDTVTDDTDELAE